MAHFAEINSSGVVTNVVVIDNNILMDDYGNEVEQKGIDYCSQLFGHSNWVQTSYNASFRKKYASVGGFYDSDKDEFIEPQPNEWFYLDENNNWVCPVGINPRNGLPFTEEELEWMDAVYLVTKQSGSANV